MNQRPFEVSEIEYPFRSHWFEQDGVRMHYVDEGQGVPVVLCHGNPTWSYLYRHIIKSMSPDFRCIAYDLPGFGFSDHPPSYGYTPQEHAEWVDALLFEHLGLDACIFVMQDWGGPIGLSVATRHPDKTLGVVISSTFIGAPTTVGRLFSNFMGSRLGQYLIYRHNFFAKTIVPMMLTKKPSQITRKAYTQPFPTILSRTGTAVFPVQIVAATPWLEEVKARLGSLQDKPVEFVFGLKDPGTRPADMARWLEIFPRAGVQMDPTAGHYTQEDCPERYVVALQRIATKLG